MSLEIPSNNVSKRSEEDYVRAAIREKRRPASITTKLTASEKKQIEHAALRLQITPSAFVRTVLIEYLIFSPTQFLILGEVCALRKQTEELLQMISDLTDTDIERARRAADRLRAALVEERALELQARETLTND